MKAVILIVLVAFCQPQAATNSRPAIACLDFDINRVTAIGRDQLPALVKEGGFTEVHSKFRRKGISVFLSIRRREYGFVLDTAYAGTFVVPYGKKLPFLQDRSIAVPGSSRDRKYPNQRIAVNGVWYATQVTVTAAGKTPKMGMGFIKSFNWIIDTGRKKVYLVKNTVQLSSGQ